jgi:hypothetical protein
MDLPGIEPGEAALFLVRACSGLSCMGCRHGDLLRPSSTHTRPVSATAGPPRG